MKKSISELLSYVLLILLSLSLAMIVYGFLQYKVRIPEKIECPQEVSVYIINSTCENNKVEFYIKNNGFWNISGINIKVFYNFILCGFKETDYNLAPNEINNFSIDINCNPNKLEILPYMKIKNKKIYCSNAKISQEIC